MKKDLRRYYKSLRDRISQDEKDLWDENIRQKLFNMDIFTKSSSIFTYYSIGNEITTKEIIKKSLSLNKKVYIPKIIEKGKMIAVRIKSFDDLVDGYFNIPTSKSNESTDKIDLCLVAGLSYDSNKYRLGYGGGYYDKFIKEHKSFYVGLFYDISESFNLNIDQFDEKLDMIITDKKII